MDIESIWKHSMHHKYSEKEDSHSDQSQISKNTNFQRLDSKTPGAKFKEKLELLFII